MTALQELKSIVSEAGNSLSDLKAQNKIMQLRIKALRDLVEMRSEQVQEYKRLYVEAREELSKLKEAWK